MGPTRTVSSGQKSKAKKSRSEDSSHAVPGVQKIKSSLRQTRRLLAKDNLAADVRVETERRLKSLEGDLAQAERALRERTLATKYHKVKFFERQKACRKIKHVKKIMDAPDSPPDSLSSLRETLFSHRVDLNYILHYPKTKKYISLYKAGEGEGSAQTDRQREELRQWVRSAMENGEMDSEPEEKMDKSHVQGEGMDWEEELPRTGKGKKQTESTKAKGVPGDVFFEASGDEESDGG